MIARLASAVPRSTSGEGFDPRAADFARIRFGHASAEREASQHPEFLKAGYVDPADFRGAVFRDRRYLVLGRKGSGKSAFGLHLGLRASTRHDEFVTTSTASALVAQTPGGRDIAGDATAFQWTMVLQLLSSIATDEQARSGSDELNSVFRLLSGHGLLAPDNLQRRPRQRSTVTARDPLFKALEVTREPVEEDIRGDVAGDRLLRRVVGIAARAVRSNWHVLVVDGFEEEQVERRDTRLVLSRLVRAAAALNVGFAREGARLLVVVLCRTDIFSRLPMSDRNKLRQDAALELDWYTDYGLDATTSLGRLVNARTQLSLGRGVLVHSEFFDWKFRGRVVHRQIVRFTRCTPRDVIVFLGHLGTAVAASGELSGRTLSRAARAYALSYLWHEIEDELETYLPEGGAVTALEILRQVGTPTTFDTFAAQCPPELDPSKVLRLLYDCAAIGQPRARDVAFRYSAPLHEPRMGDSFVVHPGLAFAFSDRRLVP